MAGYKKRPKNALYVTDIMSIIEASMVPAGGLFDDLKLGKRGANRRLVMGVFPQMGPVISAIIQAIEPRLDEKTAARIVRRTSKAIKEEALMVPFDEGSGRQLPA